MLFKDGERPPGVPDYYIMEERETECGIVRGWRNPYPDSEEHEKGMRDAAEYLLDCCLRNASREEKGIDIEHLLCGESHLYEQSC